MLKVITYSILVLVTTISNLSAKIGMGDVFDDWAEYCEPYQSNQESCNLYQTLSIKGSKKPLVSLRVQYIEGKKSPILFVTLPLGVLLNFPAKLEIAGQKLDLKYQFCEQEGCSTAIVLTAPMLKIMYASEKLLIKYVNKERKWVGIPISLKGFQRGMAKITPAKKP